MKLSVILVFCFVGVHSVTSQGSRYSCAGRCYENRRPSWCKCDVNCDLYQPGCCDDYQRHCSSFSTPCGNPPQQKNGDFSTEDGETYEEYPDGTTVTYSCNRGYVKSSFDDITSTCRNGNWNPSSVERCRAPVFRFCNAPIVNDLLISYSPMSASYATGAEIVFSCPGVGYRLDGSAIVTCIGTHTWTPIPTCERISCPHNGAPIYGGYSPSHQTTWYPGDVVNYYCDGCYTLQGERQGRCNYDGTWNYPAPTCGKPCEYPNHPESGYIRPSYNPSKCYGYGDYVDYFCNVGYILQERQRVTCNLGGYWSHTPKCIRNTCPHRRAPRNGSYKPGGKTTWYVGDVATYSCRGCYFLDGFNRSRCRRDGTWTNAVPTCRQGCRRPRNPRRGFILPQGKQCFSDKERIRYRCNRGYELQGKAVVRCNDGSWSHAPTCKRIECPNRRIPTYGSYTPTGKTTWYPEDTVTYSCPPYYTLVGNAQSRCGYNGRWSSGVPVCQLTSPCNDRCSPEYTHDAICQCHPYCTEDCCPDAGYCDSCPTLNDPDDGHVEVNGKEARYNCNDRYYIVGNSRRVCVNGAWEGSAPICRPSAQDPPTVEILSCANRCGEPGGTIEFPCDCDEGCVGYDSCCPDYNTFCP